MRDLIFQIEGSDDGHGLRFYDPDLSRFKLELQEEAEGQPRLTTSIRFHLKEMDLRGWVEFRQAAGVSTVLIQPNGHEAAEFFRENTRWRRTLKYFGRWSDRVLQSIIVPIIVAVITVLILNYLGLDGAASEG